MWLSDTCIEGVLNVLAMSYPFEVANVIVFFISVDMVYLWQIVWVGDECMSNQSIYSAVLVFAVC